MTGKHRDGKHNPLERPQTSEEEDKVVEDGTSHAGQQDSLFQADVRKDPEIPQVIVRHFVRLPIDRQQREVTARSTARGRDYHIQADFGGNPNKTTTSRVIARKEAEIGRHQRGLMSTEQNSSLILVDEG